MIILKIYELKDSTITPENTDDLEVIEEKQLDVSIFPKLEENQFNFLTAKEKKVIGNIFSLEINGDINFYRNLKVRTDKLKINIIKPKGVIDVKEVNKNLSIIQEKNMMLEEIQNTNNNLVQNKNKSKKETTNIKNEEEKVYFVLADKIEEMQKKVTEREIARKNK